MSFIVCGWVAWKGRGESGQYAAADAFSPCDCLYRDYLNFRQRIVRPDVEVIALQRPRIGVWVLRQSHSQAAPHLAIERFSLAAMATPYQTLLSVYAKRQKRRGFSGLVLARPVDAKATPVDSDTSRGNRLDGRNRGCDSRATGRRCAGVSIFLIDKR
jgi:hypothetical protein